MNLGYFVKIDFQIFIQNLFNNRLFSKNFKDLLFNKRLTSKNSHESPVKFYKIMINTPKNSDFWHFTMKNCQGFESFAVTPFSRKLPEIRVPGI